jgi:hypothetical protein
MDTDPSTLCKFFDAESFECSKAANYARSSSVFTRSDLFEKRPEVVCVKDAVVRWELAVVRHGIRGRIANAERRLGCRWD